MLGNDSNREMRPRVRIGVVGLGYWGPNLVRNLHEVESAEMAIVCDVRPAALAAIKRRYPGLRTTTRYQDVLEDPSIDAVAIATPVTTHAALASAALDAGKHVFVEKPLASSAADAAELVDLANAHERVLMPGHTFLYSPPVNAVRERIKARELGHIYFISMMRVNLGLHQPDVSVVWDLGPHDFSILRFWLGESPVRVSALSRGCIMHETPDVAFINFEYRSGTIAHVELSWLAPSKLRRTAIVGSQKMVVYDDTSHEPVRVFDSGVSVPNPESFGEYHLAYRTGDIVSPRIDAAEPLFLEMEDFCRAILTGSQPRASAELGAEVVEVAEAVDRSLANAGAPAEVRPATSLSTLRERAEGGPEWLGV
jgi:predicted dehydrogenase